VLSIDAPKEKPFDTVKADVRKTVVETETARLVRELADKLADRLKTGEDIAKVAADAGGTPDKLEDVKRNQVPPGLTQDAVQLAFTLGLNGAAHSLTTDRGSRSVMKVTSITPPGELGKADRDKLVEELKRELQNDVLIAYVSTLQDKLGVNINEQEFQRATGADVAQQ
jgi:peptidyl-prolyl cis-trans isomerase D